MAVEAIPAITESGTTFYRKYGFPPWLSAGRSADAGRLPGNSQRRSVRNVTSASPDPPAGGQSAAPARAQTLVLQGLANRLVRGLLRTPLLNRIVGGRLVTLYIVGRKSGRRYTVPVAYTRYDGGLLFGTPFAWGRNLRTGEPVDIRLKGRRRSADVQAFTDEAGVTERYAVMARDNHSFAKFNKIGLDQDGNPDPADLHLAWAAGARAFQLAPR
jgi:hypothetical protein